MRQDIGGKEAEEIAVDGAVSADHFTWHPVSRAVGNVKNQGPELIEAIKPCSFDDVRNVPDIVIHTLRFTLLSDSGYALIGYEYCARIM